MNNPRGSIWRKWDLHVHTPASYVNSFNDWDSYIKKLNEVTKRKDIKVLGLTDYFSIDGYEKITTKYQDKIENIPGVVAVDCDRIKTAPVKCSGGDG